MHAKREPEKRPLLSMRGRHDQGSTLDPKAEVAGTKSGGVPLAQTLFPILPLLRFEKVLTESGSKARRNPLRHGFAVPPLPKGRGFGKGVKFMGLQVRFF